MEKIKQASRREFHYIYKTTNLVNGKYYIGMHSTDDLEDGYIGSGTRLRRSISKHGKENFKIEILEFTSDRESLKKRERELVNEEKLTDKMCMNLKVGGEGGWPSYAGKISGKLQAEKCFGIFSIEGKKRRLEILTKMHEDPIFKKMFGDKVSEGLKLRLLSHPHNWTDRTHSIESKKKMSESMKRSGCQLGEKNSQSGTMWITNEVESKKIKKNDLIPEGYRKGRKLGVRKVGSFL